jgi:hypothetical protein
MVRRNQRRDALPQDLFGLVAKETFGAGVPTENDAVEFLLRMASSEDSTMAASL